ncbi:transglycosylase family protein [Streptomyces sp. Da 82-17]|uniref:transglycosylase family protein n=1 Tax=Streptomyces sp. Da 82-17 TaxID=3377116 RepID=UPI0038D48F52
MTGSAIAIPLLGATGASAADATVDANTWDRLADCESGGVWNADTGNGYYGGLQLTQADWEAFGGLKYAPSADLASRAQQVAVAENVLAERGPLAWPTCGLVAGFPLTDPADGDQSDQPSEEPSEEPTEFPSDDPSAEDPTPPGDTSVEEPADTPTDSPTDAPSDDTKGETDGEADGGTGGGSDGKGSGDSADETGNSGQNGSGKHRGEPAPESPDSPEEGRDSNSSGRHASRGDGSRGDAEGAYTVRVGDSLSAIADARGVDGGWPALYAANEDAIGSDPDLILPGQRLDLG